jgi:hypothetical protein
MCLHIVSAHNGGLCTVVAVHSYEYAAPNVMGVIGLNGYTLEGAWPQHIHAPAPTLARPSAINWLVVLFCAE